jgi:hypothetical protein
MSRPFAPFHSPRRHSDRQRPKSVGTTICFVTEIECVNIQRELPNQMLRLLGTSRRKTVVLQGLDAVPWADLQHAYGSAGDVPGLLRMLRSAPSTAIHDNAGSACGCKGSNRKLAWVLRGCSGREDTFEGATSRLRVSSSDSSGVSPNENCNRESVR